MHWIALYFKEYASGTPPQSPQTSQKQPAILTHVFTQSKNLPNLFTLFHWNCDTLFGGQIPSCPGAQVDEVTSTGPLSFGRASRTRQVGPLRRWSGRLRADGRQEKEGRGREWAAKFAPTFLNPSWVSDQCGSDGGEGFHVSVKTSFYSLFPPHGLWATYRTVLVAKIKGLCVSFFDVNSWSNLAVFQSVVWGEKSSLSRQKRFSPFPLSSPLPE